MKSLGMTWILAGVLSCLAAGLTRADTYRFAAMESSDWMNGRNWQNQTAGAKGWEIPGGIPLPDAEDVVRFNYASKSGTLADDAGTVDGLQIGVDEGGHLTLNAGAVLTTDSGGWSGIGAGAASTGSLTVNDGLLTINNGWNMGWNTSAHTVLLVINGGEMRVTAGGFTQTKAATTATTIINGGLLQVNSMALSTGVVDIAGGMLRITGDYQTEVGSWTNSGLMRANGGAAGWSLAVIYSGGITTVTASPPAYITVPNVVGLAQATAESAVTEAGLTVGSVSYAIDLPGDGIEIGQVLSQIPSAGVAVLPGSAVDLVVLTEAPATVPDVTKRTQSEAESMLVSAGLVVGAVTTVADRPDDGFDPGDVISQNPAPGTGVALGTAVDLVVVIPPPAQDAPPFDVNNDGYDDLIHVSRDGEVFSTELLLSNGTDFTVSVLAGNAVNNATHDKWFAGDFNGDGLMDLARLWGGADGKVYCQVETNLQDGSMDLVSWAAGSGNYSASQRWFRGDFNGDGMDDLLEMPYHNLTLTLNVYRSTGSGFIRSTWWSSSSSRAQTDWYRVADCTGDGADDLIRIYNSGGNVSCVVYTGSGAGTAFVESSWTPGYAFDANHRWYPGDYDGDGDDDFALLRAEGGEAKADLLLSSGSSFSVSSNWIRGGTAYAYGDQAWYPADFNGDGISDLVRISGEGNYLNAKVFISTGSEFVGTTWASGQIHYPDQVDLFIADFNGDNKQDIICVARRDYQSLVDVYASTGIAFTLEPRTYTRFDRFNSLRGGPAIRRHRYFDPHVITGPIAADGGNYNDVCKSGQDVYLAKRAEYVHTDSASSWLQAKAPQQVIETFEAKTLAEFAWITRYSLTSHTLLAIANQDSALAQKIIGDGRRYEITAADVTAGFTKGGAHFFGGRNASYHRFNRIYAFNSVGQTAFKIQEADAIYRNVHRGNRIENCFVFGAGVDPRGNGRNPDLLSGWADGMGLTSRETVMRNNIVIDGTDVGIVQFTAPDSLIQQNVVASISRSCLGAINLLDTLFYDEWGINGLDPQGRKQYDFSTRVQNNYLDARGARIDVGIPVGWRIWTPPSDPSIDNPSGLEILNNELDGDAFGYGIAVGNAFYVTATGNVSTATHSGTGGYYMLPHLMPDPASAFAYAPLHTFNCTYGPEFSPASEENGLDFIIFNTKHGATYTPDGYIYTPYQPMEAVATVEMAYLEMLHRYPDMAELSYYASELISAYGRSDEIRLALMLEPEFDVVNPHYSGAKTINGMQNYRSGLWLNNLKKLDSISYNRDGNLPAAKTYYQNALACLTGDYLPAGAIVISPVPGGLNLEYEGALATSTNLQSWEVVEPQPGSPTVMPADDPARFFKAVAK